MARPLQQATAGTGTFPKVQSADIIGVLHDIDLPGVTVEDITKPTPEIAYKIFAKCLEAFNGIDMVWIKERKQEILSEVVHKELYEESLTWLIFFREVSTLMYASQVRSFGAADILNPQPKRFLEQLSALCNFSNFREERMGEFEQYVDETESLTATKEDLLQHTEDARAKIEAIQAQREAEAPMAAEISAEAQKMMQKLGEMKAEQNRLVRELEEIKDRRQRLQVNQTDLTKQIHTAREQNRKLESRIVTSPEQLRRSLQMVSEELKERKAYLSDTDHRAKSFEARIAVMKGIEEDLDTCQSLLVALSADQQGLEQLNRTLQKLGTDYDSAASAHAQLSQTLSADSRQLENAQKRHERMRRTLEEKRAMWKKREEEWSRKWADVEEERRQRSDEASRKHKEAREIEREVESELRQYDAEVASMIGQRNELVKLAEHYMDRIGESLDWDGQGLVADIDAGNGVEGDSLLED